MKRALAVAVLTCVSFVSCATTLFPRQEGFLWAPVEQDATYHLEELTITTKPTTGNLQKTAHDLALIAARKAGFALDTDSSAAFDLTMSLEEREFGIDIDTYNSVSAVLKVWAKDGRQVGQVVYAEDTKLTLRSANYLARVLGALFVQWARKVQGKK